VSASSFHHVLALLEDDSSGDWSVLDRAIELAEAEHARLTLAQTADLGGVVVSCISVCGAVTCTVPPTEAELREGAGHRLAKAAEFVPASIPLTTVLLERDTARAVRRLAESGCYDLLVVSDRLFAHSRKLRRVVRRLGISTLSVSPEPVPLPQLLSRWQIPGPGSPAVR
jgi:hypothetical protein